VLDLCASAPVERVRVAILRKAQRVPIAEGRLHTELALKGGAGQPHVWPGGAKESVLEQHARDGHHGQAAVGELRIQRPLALVGTVGLALVERPAKVTCVGKVSRCAVRLLHIEDRIDEAHEGKDLHAASDGNLSKGLQAIWDVVERQAQGRRAKPGPTEVLGGDVAHARQHRDAAMLELTGAAALELHLVPILGEPQRVKEAHRGLDAELLLEGASREPHLGARRAGHSVLEQHAGDCSHGKAPVGQLGVQPPFLPLRITDPVPAEGAQVAPLHTLPPRALVASEHARRIGRILLHVEDFHESAEGKYLDPATCRHLGKCLQA